MQRWPIENHDANVTSRNKAFTYLLTYMQKAQYNALNADEMMDEVTWRSKTNSQTNSLMWWVNSQKK